MNNCIRYFVGALVHGLLLLALTALQAQASVLPINFNNGNGTTSVDQFPGIASPTAGWNKAWTVASGTNVTSISTSVVNTTPLFTGNGNYLSNSWTVSGGTTSNQWVLLSRQIASGAINMAGPLIYNFTLRPDSTVSASNEGFTLFCATSATQNTGSTDTWKITADGSGWETYNGTTLVSLGKVGATTLAGTPFQFTIASDPTTRTYCVTITNLSNGMTATSGFIAWRNTTATSDNTFLNFVSLSNSTTGSTFAYSLDNVTVDQNGTSNLAIFGVNATPYKYSSPDAECDAIIASGVKWVRMGPSWGSIETADGTYNTALLSTIDEVVQRLTSHGVHILWILCFTATWDSTTPTDSHSGVYSPPSDYGKWAAFVSYITARYNNEISYWEVWNEEDGGGFWTGTVNQYYTLLTSASNAIRATNPNNKVVLGGLAMEYQGTVSYGLGTFFDSLMGLGAGSYFDVVNYHAYGRTDKLVSLYEGTMDVVNKYGINSKPIWITETGYSTNGTASLEPTKSDYIDDAYLMNSRFPNVTNTFVYCYADTSTSDPSEDNFGLLQNNLALLNAWFHYQAEGKAQTYYAMEAAYPTVTPTYLTLNYLPETTGDGSYVTAYDPAGTEKLIASGKYMYFALNSNYWNNSNAGIDLNAFIDVTYFDAGTGIFSLQYDGTSGAYTNQNCTLTNTNTWKTKTFTITDAKFGKDENNAADFRIYSGTAALAVGTIAVRKEAYTGRLVVGTTDSFKYIQRMDDENPVNNGYTALTTEGGVSCREILANNQYLLFRVDQGLVAPQDANIQIGVTYWDSGTDRFGVQYNSTSATEQNLYIIKTNTGTWKTAWLTITDADFTHAQEYGADFRITNGNDSSVEYISNVTVVNNAPTSLVLKDMKSIKYYASLGVHRILGFSLADFFDKKKML